MQGVANTGPSRRRCAYCNHAYLPTGYHQRYCSTECYRRDRYGFVGRVQHGTDVNPRAEHDAKTAQRATPKPVEIHQVKADDGKRYYARDADALLEEISESEQARPGLLYG